MRITVLRLIGLLCLYNLTACVGAMVTTPLIDKTIIENAEDTFPDLDANRFGKPASVENEDQIFALSDEQTQAFLNYFNDSVRKDDPGYVRLYEYMVDVGTRFTYASQTNNAEATLRTASGNCMSLAVLTTALARVAGVEIKYQLVNRVPIYQEYGSVIFNAQHIRSVVYAPVTELGSGVLLWRNKAVIDYYPSRYAYTSGNVSKDVFLGMYYQNLAAEALGKDDYANSYWLLKRSIETDVNNAAAINTLAVLHRRAGIKDKAEDLYQFGIKNAQNKITLLRNYRVLLLYQNRLDEAEKIAKELENHEDENPFSWLLEANEAYDEADYSTALSLYKKVIDLAPYLHQGHFGIAKAEYQRGNYTIANRALEKAKEEAFDLRAKSLYEAKLVALSKERFN